MLSSNNRNEMVRRMADKKQTFVIKRLSLGVFSVLAGTMMFLGANDVSAQETTTVAPVVEITTVAPETVDPTVAAAETTTVAPEMTTVIAEESFDPVGGDATLAEVDVTITEDETFGERALEHIDYLSKEIGARTTGTPGEGAAREYILNQLKSYGYEPELQEFKFTRKGVEYTTNNIVVSKAGKLAKEIIVGAHYDSVQSGGSLGADDNASGVGITLEMAERLFDTPTNYSLKFVFFGAEEWGLKGSKAYAENMTQEEIDNTVAMINTDSIIAGDKMYIHGGLGGEQWFRDQAFDIAEMMDQDMVPSPGKNAEYPYGQTGDWSDHAPFNELGIPVAYYEGTNWDIAELDGYDQTEKYGPIFHTGMDSLDFLNENYPGRVEERLFNFTGNMYNLLTNAVAPEDLEEIKAIQEEEAKAEEEEEKIGGEGIVLAPKEESKEESKEVLPSTGETEVSPAFAALLSTLGLGFVLYSKKK